MSAVVCTLFEDHYHFGVAALTNSLCLKGFNGDIFAGYKGNLPAWCSESKENPSLKWKGAKTLPVSKGVNVHFLPLETSYHLANYKPDFMLKLWEGPAKEATEMFYFDPDIIVKENWAVFMKWVKCGVTLCEDVNSPLAMHHPRRFEWRKFFKTAGIDLQFKEAVYANSGFIGISFMNKSFLNTWVKTQDTIASVIGGLERSPFSGNGFLPEEHRGDYAPFSKTDQDALNCAVEAWIGNVSFIGKEGMALKSGPNLMSHALGKPKPWHWKPLKQAVLGQPPRLMVRDYWEHANGFLLSQPTILVTQRKVTIKIAALIGRFYRRR